MAHRVLDRVSGRIESLVTDEKIQIFDPLRNPQSVPVTDPSALLNCNRWRYDELGLLVGRKAQLCVAVIGYEVMLSSVQWKRPPTNESPTGKADCPTYPVPTSITHAGNRPAIFAEQVCTKETQDIPVNYLERLIFFHHTRKVYKFDVGVVVHFWRVTVTVKVYVVAPILNWRYEFWATLTIEWIQNVRIFLRHNPWNKQIKCPSLRLQENRQHNKVFPGSRNTQTWSFELASGP